MGMCSLGVQTMAVAVSIFLGAWKPHGCVPNQACRVQRKSHITTSGMSGHPWSPASSQATSEKDNSQPSSDSWIGWLSCGSTVAKTALIVSPGGLRKQPSILLYPELSRNPHLPGYCYVCVTSSLEKIHFNLLQFISWNGAWHQGNKIVSMGSQQVRNSVIYIFWLYFKIPSTHNWNSVN